MKTFIDRYQISIFFILTFVLSWFPWYAGIAPEVMAMGPSIAAFIVVLILGGGDDFPGSVCFGNVCQYSIHDLVVQQIESQRTDCRDRLACSDRFLGANTFERFVFGCRP